MERKVKGHSGASVLLKAIARIALFCLEEDFRCFLLDCYDGNVMWFGLGVVVLSARSTFQPWLWLKLRAEVKTRSQSY